MRHDGALIQPTLTMSNCTCTQNQTSEESYAVLSKSARSEGDDGHALFLVPAPEEGIMEYRVVLVPNLSYRETVKRGSHCTAFKWVANQIATADQLKEYRLQSRCVEFCNFAGGRCPIGCICGPGNFCS
jgi:hypothetical protein